MYFFLASLSLLGWAQAFSHWGEQGLLFLVVYGLFTVVASLVEHTLGCVGFSSCSSCGIVPDQGSNPHPLHWWADSEPLDHQGSQTRMF